MSSPLRLAAAAVLAVLALAAPASADSIVYVKDGNVFVTSPDGAKGYQVTFDGGYTSPSQADDGTIVAMQARRFVRMDRSGHPIGDAVAGVGTTPTPGTSLYGPYEPRVSPDGKRIAYWFGSYTSYYDPGCYCSLFHIEDNVTWSYADHFTDPSTESDFYKGLTQPEWLTNDRILAGYPDFWMSGWTWKIGTGHGYTGDSAQWWYQFKDDQGYNFFPSDPALSPDGTKLAVTNDSDPNTKKQLLLAAVSGPAWVGEPPYTNDYLGNSAVQQPAQTCTAKFDAGLRNPTWAPDSSRFAIAQKDGVHVYAVPDVTDCSTITDTLLAPGGDEPAWGKADVDLAQKPQPPAAPQSTPAGAPGAGPSAGTPDAGRAPVLSGLRLAPTAFRAARRGPAIASATGTRMSFSLSGPASLTLRVKGVKGAIKTAGKPGLNHLRFMGRVAGRSLRRGRYTLVVTATPKLGGVARTLTAGFRITG